MSAVADRLERAGGVAGWLVGVLAATAVVMLFTLEGAPAPTEIATAAGDPDGAAIYAARCAACHGGDGNGGIGPSLRGIVERYPEPATMRAVVENGRLTMPAFAPSLSEPEIDAVVTWIRDAWR